MLDLDCQRFHVSGKVQGVFFRAETARQASRLGLKGYAHNLPDGRVEVLACGRRAAVEELARWLAHGPPRASVTGVTRRTEQPSDYAQLGGFTTG